MNNSEEEIKKNKFWVGVILYNPVRKSVLMQKRDDKAPVNPNLWALFGGTGELGESVEECLVREVSEEINVKIDFEKTKYLRDYLHPRSNRWRYTYVMEFDKQKSEMKLGEGADFDWIPLNEVLELDLTENTRSDLEFFIKNIN